ncbi:MAG: hypothetical protein JWM74_225, partial [Myxococcaceae bacterium]|nr:hypothetical protein [Myxococcaceae bacterium]
MTAPRRLRDIVRDVLPVWLRDRPGRTSAFRFIWSMIAPLDAALDVLDQGLHAALPGEGTPTALPLIGRSRGILRGQDETSEAYGVRLRAWLSTWRGDLPDGGGAGSQLAIAMAFHAYLRNHPRVRVVNRAGRWTTVNADGSIVVTDAAWNWDSVSHPERATHWWNQWVIVYPTQWADAGFLDTPGDVIGGETGIGHMCTRVEVDALMGQILQWSSAESLVRAVIWTSDPALFDPAVPLSCPDGTWGAWSSRGSGPRVPSGRNTTSCR